MADVCRVKDQFAACFITLTVIDWGDVFTRKEYKEILIDSLKYCIANKGLQVYEFVIMSNHLHSIVSSDKVPLSGLKGILKNLRQLSIKKVYGKKIFR